MNLTEKARDAVRICLKKRREKKQESALAMLVRQSNELFQIEEYAGELWLKYDGYLIMPCTMLNETPIDALRKIRACYVARKSRK